MTAANGQHRGAQALLMHYLPAGMRTSIVRLLFVLLVFQLIPPVVSAKDLGWQPQKTWVFVVGVLSWKHSETFASFPVKNRRDNTLVEFFKQSGVPESQVVYLQDKQATQQRINNAFAEQLKKLRADDLLIVY